MILRFDDFEIDPGRGELRKAGETVHVGPRTLALLHLLASHHERMVSKDEIVETVWDGRAVSDSAISTAIKEARKAVGDDGVRQKVIRTVHGQGFRCVADVKLTAAAAVAPAGSTDRQAGPSSPPAAELYGGRPSIAVLPFRHLDPGRSDDPISDAIPAELISALARLRWLAVTARGSSFRIRGDEDAPQTVRELLGVGYCLTGLVEDTGSGITVAVELAETKAGNVIWAERFTAARSEVQKVRSEIAAAVIAALEIRIPLNEANVARLLGPGNLDAWAEYHLGLQHMYRFNRHDNEISQKYFRSAIAKEDGFARAHAALSFTAFQEGFMHYAADPAEAVDRARQSAERSLELDFLDPFGNYCMARVDWLAGDPESSLGWLDRSLKISPNFAQAHYLQGLMLALEGEGERVRTPNETAMALSPLDPLHYAMLATHAMSYMNEENFDEARSWAERAASAPGCHHMAAVTAIVANELAGHTDRARFWMADVLRRRPDVNADAFFRSFPYADTAARARIADALQKLGF